MAEVNSLTTSSVLPHSGTKLLHKYTPYDYGPLASLPDAASVVSSFRGGTYYLTEVEGEEGVVLYRLHDDIRAEACGRYWTMEKRKGVLGDRIDLAIPLKWNNLSKINSLFVPKGVLLFEGPIAPQTGGPVGGGWQIFIPGEVLKPLCKSMELSREDQSGDGQAKREHYFQEAKLNQKVLFEVYEREVNKYNQDIIDTFCKAANEETFLTVGNNLCKLDRKLLATLKASSQGKRDKASVNVQCHTMEEKVELENTTYLLHSEELRMADGSMKCLRLYAKLEPSLETHPPMNVTFAWRY